jgi:hypothetical protein
MKCLKNGESRLRFQDVGGKGTLETHAYKNACPKWNSNGFLPDMTVVDALTMHQTIDNKHTLNEKCICEFCWIAYKGPHKIVRE